MQFTMNQAGDSKAWYLDGIPDEVFKLALNSGSCMFEA